MGWGVGEMGKERQGTRRKGVGALMNRASNTSQRFMSEIGVNCV